MTPFWLSHHPDDELDRTWRIGRFHVCARCLGTYPTAFVTIALLLHRRAPLDWELDVPVGIALVLPATLDWAIGRFRPHAFSNLWRTATGVLLGLGLGRSLFIHLQRPFPTVLLWQAIVVLAIALPVFLMRYRGRKAP